MNRASCISGSVSSRTRRWKGVFSSSSSVVFWYLRISLRSAAGEGGGGVVQRSCWVHPQTSRRRSGRHASLLGSARTCRQPAPGAWQLPVPPCHSLQRHGAAPAGAPGAHGARHGRARALWGPLLAPAGAPGRRRLLERSLDRNPLLRLGHVAALASRLQGGAAGRVGRCAGGCAWAAMLVAWAPGRATRRGPRPTRPPHRLPGHAGAGCHPVRPEPGPVRGGRTALGAPRAHLFGARHGGQSARCSQSTGAAWGCLGWPQRRGLSWQTGLARHERRVGGQSE